jgi:hypothetical protein
MVKVPPNHLIPDDFNIPDEILIKLAKDYGIVTCEKSYRNAE